MQKILILGNGYIGSYLYKEFQSLGLDCSILSKTPDNNNHSLIVSDYKDLSAGFLSRYSHILWFAGHSSVHQSIKDPVGSVSNNVIGLYELGQKISFGTKLIYASSASIYSGIEFGKAAGLTDGVLHSLNSYDATKKAFDLIVQTLPIQSIGLRMGTVCGYSPKTRNELIFNSMNISAIENGVVNVANASNFRTLLFLDDLKELVLKILDPNFGNYDEKFINAGSVNLSIGEIADLIASFHNVKIKDHGNNGAYSFKMRLSRELPDPVTVIHEQCASFRREYTK